MSLPDNRMRFRIAGQTSDAAYLEVGERCFRDIQGIAASTGLLIDKAPAVLDFGCGCARVLRYWPQVLLPRRFFSHWRRGRPQIVCGTDIDAPSIEYSAREFPQFQFDTNDPRPPTRYEPGKFALIYAVSVFSHLRQDYAVPWIAELRRIIAFPNALLIVSVHGMAMVPETHTPALDEQGQKKDVWFQPTDFWSEHYPDWYGNLFVSEAGVRALFAPHFELIRYLPLGMAGFQDVAVLRPCG